MDKEILNAKFKDSNRISDLVADLIRAEITRDTSPIQILGGLCLGLLGLMTTAPEDQPPSFRHLRECATDLMLSLIAVEDNKQRKGHLATEPVAAPEANGDHQPIQEDLRALMNALATVIREAVNPDGEKRNGFCLLVFPFGQPTGEHRCNYICNADRDDMIATMREFIARAEGRFLENDNEDSRPV